MPRLGTKRKFRRTSHFLSGGRGRGRANRKDSRGKVGVQVVLRNGTAPQAGNIVRSFTAEDARVSEVATVIERALFGQGRPFGS